jgi:hypothetical protein
MSLLLSFFKPFRIQYVSFIPSSLPLSSPRVETRRVLFDEEVQGLPIPTPLCSLLSLRFSIFSFKPSPDPIQLPKQTTNRLEPVYDFQVSVLVLFKSNHPTDRLPDRCHGLQLERVSVGLVQF